MVLESIYKDNGDVPSKELKTVVSDTEISFSFHDINSYFGLQDVTEPLKEFTEPELVTVFKPKKKTSVLNFTPGGMNDINRVIHYIYLRSMVNKANNFTHFSRNDLQYLPALIIGHKLDAGKIIFEEMKRFVIGRDKLTPIPYPQLVSFILSRHNIWYLKDDNVVKEVGSFGEYHMKRIHSNTMLLESLRPRPVKVQSQASPSNQDEAQSSAPASSAPAPSFLHASYRVLLQEEFGIFEDSLLKKVVAAIENNINLILPVMERHNEIIKSNFETLINKIASLEVKVDNLESTMTKLVSSQEIPAPAPLFEVIAPLAQETSPITPPPLTSEAQDDPDPDDLVQRVLAAIREESNPSSQPPSTSQPSMIIEPLITPSSPTFNVPSPQASSSSASIGTLFDEFKGGEE